MIDLVQGGAISPGAEDVAARAQVGLRSVFRHFKDMDTLYREMSLRLARDYALWLVPYAAADWRGQLRESIDRRLTTYERLGPFKRAADVHRHESTALQSEHERTLLLMRAKLRSILPPEIADDVLVFEALDLLLSFDAWQRLRHDQGLPPETARAVIESQVERLVGGVSKP